MRSTLASVIVALLVGAGACGSDQDFAGGDSVDGGAQASQPLTQTPERDSTGLPQEARLPQKVSSTTRSFPARMLGADRHPRESNRF